MTVRRTAIIPALAGVLLAGSVSLFAHHSLAAEFDLTKPATLAGTVTKVEWVNPHARFFADVKDADGKVTNFEFELLSPKVLLRNGWTRTSLKPGDVVTVKGNLARNGSPLMNARSVEMSDGRKVFAGSSGGTKTEK